MSLLNTFQFITNHPLNRNHKFTALLRFLKWQLASRLVPGTFVYPWVNNAKFFVKSGETGLTGNIYTGLHEFPDMGFLLHFLRPSDLFLDIGANVGSYTLLASASVGARSIAFEPVPKTYQRLLDNIRLNHLDEKVQCVNKGLGDQDGELSFTSDNDTMNHALAPNERCQNKVSVPVTTLDAFLQNQSPTLAKIDVEGFETLVLKGASQTLQNPSFNAIIMELNDSGQRYGFSEDKILKSLSELNFDTFSYDPLTRQLTPLNHKNTHSGNTLFIRDKSFVEERLKTAPKITVHHTQF